MGSFKQPWPTVGWQGIAVIPLIFFHQFMYLLLFLDISTTKRHSNDFSTYWNIWNCVYQASVSINELALCAWDKESRWLINSWQTQQKQNKRTKTPPSSWMETRRIGASARLVSNDESGKKPWASPGIFPEGGKLLGKTQNSQGSPLVVFWDFP